MPIQLPSAQDLADYILPRLTEWNVPGVAVAVVDGQETLLAEGFGLRDQAADLPVDPQTLFAIASNTKAFVSTALGVLVQDGRLAWDDRVRRFLPEFELYAPYVSDDLRVRDLLCHRSGLASYAGDLLQGSNVSPTEIVRRLRHLPQGFPFRAGFGYCNLLYLAAGQLLSAVAGEPWEAFIRRRLLEPLGMAQTCMSARELPEGGNVAVPYEEVDGSLVPVSYHLEDNIGPAGAMCSAAADLARWIRFQLAGGQIDGQRLVEPATIEETRTAHTAIRPTARERRRHPCSHLISDGLGWSLMDYRGKLLIRHTGGLDGMLSVTGFAPEDSLGVVVLSNQNPNSFFMALFYHLLDSCLGLSPLDHHADLLADHRQEAAAALQARRRLVDGRPAGGEDTIGDLAGTYHHPYLGEATVGEEGGLWVLRLAAHPHKHGILEPWGREACMCRWSELSWQESLLPVLRDDRDQVAGFRMRVREDWIDSLEYTFQRL
jgi:CubicO group peptidase (beta-lactamase class C family)